MQIKAQCNFPLEEYQQLVDEAMKYAKRHGAQACELVLGSEKGFSVAARKGDVETVEHHQEKSLAVTVYQDQRQGSASTSDLSRDAMLQMIDKAATIAKYANPDPYAGLAEPEYLAYQYPDLELYHPWKLSTHQAIDLAIECESVARAQDTRIKESEGASVSTFEYFQLYANSHGFVGYYPATDHGISCGVVAESDGCMERDYEYTHARHPELLEDAVLVARKAAEKTLKRLDAKKLKTQTCPVIFHAPVAKGLLGAFISAISGKSLYRKSTFLLDHLGKVIFPSYITIKQRPHRLGALGSAPFDGDGVKTQDIAYVKSGVLESYVLGSYSARKLGLQTTGNAGGIFNLTISHSDLNLTKLVAKMGTGLLITELLGQGVRILTGDYSRGAAGFWVENGVIQYPVNEITIAGNLKQMFQGIVAVANDIDERGTIHTGSMLIESMMVAGQ